MENYAVSILRLFNSKNRIMKRITLSLMAVVLMLSAFAVSTPKLTQLSAEELKKIDLSGKYIGKRHQYTADKKSILQTFEYEFELKQEGNIITGVSTIINENGDYADIKLRGVLVGDKLHFEEYEIQSQAKAENRVWCFKSGELMLRKSGEQLKLVGATASYMADYFYPCSGGYTDLVKVDNSSNLVEIKSTTSALESLTDNGLMNVYPNPFIENSKISYTLHSDSKVSLEMFDITGKSVAVLENNVARNQGTYTVDFSGNKYGFSAGIFIAKLTVNGSIYSKQMVQMK
jgi:hypothetical protein